MIAGIAGGSVVVILALVALVCCACRRRKEDPGFLGELPTSLIKILTQQIPYLRLMQSLGTQFECREKLSLTKHVECEHNPGDHFRLSIQA
jgi:hypothetical protein